MLLYLHAMDAAENKMTKHSTSSTTTTTTTDEIIIIISLIRTNAA